MTPIIISRDGLSVSLLPLGARIQDVRLQGFAHSLTLGSTDLDAYHGEMAYFGAIVGPVANRIAGAGAILDGQRLAFEANEGTTSLHGGETGTHAQIWRVAHSDAISCEMELALPDGLGGYPGNRTLRAAFRLEGNLTLRLDLTATTDAPTLINLANHSYWCLDASGDITGHRLTIAAPSYTAVDDDLIPTEVAPVAGTPFDFRSARKIGRGAVDHNFCLAQARRAPEFACRLEAPSGLALTIATSEPGLQVYDANRMDTGPFKGHGGKAYGRYAGLALEPQVWPDAPNRADFPPVRLDAGQSYAQVTTWQFNR